MGAATRRHLRWMVALLLFPTLAPGTVDGQPPSCAACSAFGEQCTLEYGAAGTVRDSATSLPIAGAAITVVDLSTVSDADGSFAVRGTRPETCHIDYLWSIHISADGYEPLRLSGYFSSGSAPLSEFSLDPVVAAKGFDVFGFVAEFPHCSGRMRGVTVTLDPLGLSTDTSVGSDGGFFEFSNVPPGDYVLRVAQGCNPFGCWIDTPVQVVDAPVDVEICMDELTPVFSPTPSRTGSLSPTPTRVPTACPRLTACPHGEQPRPCDQPCGLHCGCEARSTPTNTPTFPTIPGRTLAPTVTPTRLPTRCPRLTPCPPGEQPRPCDDPCRLGCGCELRPTPTDTPCPVATHPSCSVGQELVCTGECLIDCQCRSCAACPDGMEYAELGCDCVAADHPTETNTNRSSSDGCAIDPQATSGSALLLAAPLLWPVARQRFARRP